MDSSHPEIYLNSKTTIFMDLEGRPFIRQGSEILVFDSEKSMLLLLPVFQDIREKKTTFASSQLTIIKQAIPFNLLLTFLLIKMQTPYWINVVASFVLVNNISNMLDEKTINLISQGLANKSLPQETRHLLKRVLVESKR